MWPEGRHQPRSPRFEQFLAARKPYPESAAFVAAVWVWSGSLSLWLLWDLEESPWPVELFAAGAFAAIFTAWHLRTPRRLSRVRHLLHAVFCPSWMLAFLLVNYSAVCGR